MTSNLTPTDTTLQLGNVAYTPDTKQSIADNTLFNDSIILQNLYTGVLWVNENLAVIWANTQSEQILSTSQSRLIGLDILDILSPNESANETDTPNVVKDTEIDTVSLPKQTPHLHKQFMQARDYQQPFIEYSLNIKGITYPLLVNYSVTPVESVDSTYFLIELWEEKTHGRINQESQIQEQHDVARQMLRSVAHEVKNPLAGIRGAAQLLIKQTQRHKKRLQNTSSSSDSANDSALVLVDEKKLTTYVNIVISETDRLTGLIEQLIGSNQLPVWQTVNIHEPLEHVLMLTQTRHPEVIILRDYDLSLPELTADKNQLIQVFLNLVNNACDAMLEQDISTQRPDYRATLKITTRIEYQYTIGTTHHRQVVKVCVQDNGAGIDNELIGRIFFPLVTGRANGTGLGLALVQEMVHRHCGAIKVESEFGNTSFCIYLPLVQQDNHANP